MNISLQNESRIGHIPPALVALSCELTCELFHAKHKFRMRHPLAIYQISLRRVFDGFDAVVSEIYSLILEAKFKKPDPEERVKTWDYWADDLLVKQRRLLYALMEHMDDSDKLLLAFFKTESERNDNPYFKKYRRKRNEYRKHIGNVVNEMKHNQGMLCGLILFNDDLFIPGYFVESVIDANGTLGPNPNIHTNSRTSFSFYYDLRYHLGWLYLNSYYLCEAINSICSPNLETYKSSFGSLKVIESVIKRVSELPTTIYIDEYEKAFMQIGVKPNQLNITYSEDVSPSPVTYKKAFVLGGYISDGVSTTRIIPYWTPNNKPVDMYNLKRE